MNYDFTDMCVAQRAAFTQDETKLVASNLLVTKEMAEIMRDGEKGAATALIKAVRQSQLPKIIRIKITFTIFDRPQAKLAEFTMWIYKCDNAILFHMEIASKTK